MKYANNIGQNNKNKFKVLLSLREIFTNINLKQKTEVN